MIKRRRNLSPRKPPPAIIALLVLAAILVGFFFTLGSGGSANAPALNTRTTLPEVDPYTEQYTGSSADPSSESATIPAIEYKAPALSLRLFDAEHNFYAVESTPSEPPVDYTSRIEGLLQMPVLPSGCEPVSLTIILKSMGFDIGLTEIVDGYLEYGGDIVNQFSGDPYAYGGAFPPALVKAANAYLEAKGASERSYDLTGSSFDDLTACTQAGYPLLLWTTMYMEEPRFAGSVDDLYQWYDNEHCVVFYGIEGNTALVSDPLEGLVYRDLGEFSRIYDTCGQMAAIIL